MSDATVGAMFVYSDETIIKPKLINPFTQAQMYYQPHLFTRGMSSKTNITAHWKVFNLCITAGRCLITTLRWTKLSPGDSVHRRPTPDILINRSPRGLLGHLEDTV